MFNVYNGYINHRHFTPSSVKTKVDIYRNKLSLVMNVFPTCIKTMRTER